MEGNYPIFIGWVKVDDNPRQNKAIFLCNGMTGTFIGRRDSKAAEMFIEIYEYLRGK